MSSSRIILSVIITMLALMLFSQQFPNHNRLIISILPLGNIPDKDITLIKNSLGRYCQCDIKILDRDINPEEIMTFKTGIYPFKEIKSNYLKNFIEDENEKLIAVTDIPFKMNPDDSSEFSIRGLSKMNGNRMIISNVQILRDARTHQLNYYYLLIKVVKHELAHLFGMNHCADTTCIMTSSMPKPENFLNSKSFCNNCNSIVQKNGCEF